MNECQTSCLRAATNSAMQLVAFFTCFANHKQFVSWAIFGAGLLPSATSISYSGNGLAYFWEFFHDNFEYKTQKDYRIRMVNL